MAIGPDALKAFNPDRMVVYTEKLLEAGLINGDRIIYLKLQRRLTKHELDKVKTLFINEGWAEVEADWQSKRGYGGNYLEYTFEFREKKKSVT